MPKFLICFRVEQVLSGSIEVEAESVEDAKVRFASGNDDDPIDEARREAKLDLEDSEDSMTEIQDEEGRSLWTEGRDLCDENIPSEDAKEAARLYEETGDERLRTVL